MILKIGTKVLWGSFLLALATVPLAILVSPWWWLLEFLFAPLVLIGLWDYTQSRHSILRNYPIIGHFRFLLEDMGPELHQYLVEDNTSGRPFNRDTRAIIYRRAKSVTDTKPFGTEQDVYAEGYTYLKHSILTRPVAADPVKEMRITVGGGACSQPYSLSVLNISAMSFGALGGNAVLAMNTGAKLGDFAHDTGEGGISRYHRGGGGDLIWQIGTGYFGCRTPDGDFDPDLFAKNATRSTGEDDRDQGLAGRKARPRRHPARREGDRGDRRGAARRGRQDRSSRPPTHTAFSTPLEMVTFVARLRELSGGKPVGFKICIGEPREFMAIVKAMLETGILVDFIVVDGGEGGTGAAPQEFSDSMGFPLMEGLAAVHNILVGAGIRDQIRVGASGKMVTASAIATAMALGADWCNSARAFMFSVGCIQAQRCNTNRCPVGVTSQDPKLQRALVVPDKAERVRHFHRNTVHALAEFVAAMGLDHTSELAPHHVVRRISSTQVASLDEIYPFLNANQLLDGEAPSRAQRYWNESSSETFRYNVSANSTPA